jgi:hypothetical protein
LTNERLSPLIVVDLPGGQPDKREIHSRISIGPRFREKVANHVRLWLGRPGAQWRPFLAMSRGAQPFTQHQLTKAIKAAAKSGVPDWRIEITDGRRKMVITGGATPPDAKDDGNPWDDAK